MPDSGPIRWTPSPVLPKTPMSFADVGYEEMLSRARALKPVLAERAEELRAPAPLARRDRARPA